MRKFDKWLRRSIESVEGMPVGAPLELWRVVPKHPGNDWLRDKAKQLGRYTDSDLTYDTSRSHLLDVLYAGGAIEYTVARIDAICDAVQAFAEEHEIDAQAQDVPMGLRTMEVDDAYWEYANLLTWVRTLLDRMRSTDPHSRATLGLIPALSEHTPLRRAVETLLDRLTRDPLIEDEVHFTNYGLHLHALPGGGTPVARVTTDGRVRLLIPDKPGQRVYLFDQFTYDDERELVSFAHAVLDRVESFVDELLGAFETGTRDALVRRRHR
jgi:hypothetical protein